MKTSWKCLLVFACALISACASNGAKQADLGNQGTTVLTHDNFIRFEIPYAVNQIDSLTGALIISQGAKSLVVQKTTESDFPVPDEVESGLYQLLNESSVGMTAVNNIEYKDMVATFFESARDKLVKSSLGSITIFTYEDNKRYKAFLISSREKNMYYDLLAVNFSKKEFDDLILSIEEVVSNNE